MYNGQKFRSDCLAASQRITSGVVESAPACAERAKYWAEVGSELIDLEDSEIATRFLLATIGNLADQNAVNTQYVIDVISKSMTKKLLIPVWISTVSITLIAWNVVF